MSLTFAPSARFSIQSPADFDRYAAAVASAGFDGITLGLHDVQTLDPEVVAKTIERHGLFCSDFTALIVTRHDEQVMEKARALAPYVEATGAESVLTLVWAEPNDETCDRLVRCAQTMGAPCALEVSPLIVNTVDDGLDVIKRVGHDNAVLLIDSYHFYRAGSTLEMLDGLDPALIGIVQFDDALPAVSEDYGMETQTRRAWPGEGELDLTAFADAIVATGYDGAISVEVLLGDRADAYSIEEFTKRAYETTAPYWTELGA